MIRKDCRITTVDRYVARVARRKQRPSTLRTGSLFSGSVPRLAIVRAFERVSVVGLSMIAAISAL